MVQLTDVERAEIQRKLNPPKRERSSGVEVIDLYEQARWSGPQPGQLFRHKKSGGVYQVMTVALMEATLEPVVVYHPLFPNPNGIGPVFTRPLSEWREKFVDASGPGRGDPAENGVSPAADALAMPRAEGDGLVTALADAVRRLIPYLTNTLACERSAQDGMTDGLRRMCADAKAANAALSRLPAGKASDFEIPRPDLIDGD